MPRVPRYCRVTRVIRDISSDDIVVGNKRTNFRQIAEDEIARRGQRLVEIRAREIRGEPFDDAALEAKETGYATASGREVFLELVTPEDRIVGSLGSRFPPRLFVEELGRSALVRELHVTGGSVRLGHAPRRRRAAPRPRCAPARPRRRPRAGRGLRFACGHLGDRHLATTTASRASSTARSISIVRFAKRRRSARPSPPARAEPRASSRRGGRAAAGAPSRRACPPGRRRRRRIPDRADDDVPGDVALVGGPPGSTPITSTPATSPSRPSCRHCPA